VFGFTIIVQGTVKGAVVELVCGGKLSAKVVGLTSYHGFGCGITIFEPELAAFYFMV